MAFTTHQPSTSHIPSRKLGQRVHIHLPESKPASVDLLHTFIPSERVAVCYPSALLGPVLQPGTGIETYRSTTPDIFERISLFSFHSEWNFHQLEPFESDSKRRRTESKNTLCGRYDDRMSFRTCFRTVGRGNGHRGTGSSSFYGGGSDRSRSSTGWRWSRGG